MTVTAREIVASGPGTPAPRRPKGGRARWRRILYVAGLVPLVAALAFSAKVVVMLSHDGAGEDAWLRHDGATALEAYSANRSLNLLEPWIAPFDQGDAAFLLHDYPSARDLFTTALRTVPHHQECIVRINLALADEAIGDAAARKSATAEAKAAWQDGVGALNEGDCTSSATAGPHRSRDASQVRDRLLRKLTPHHKPTPRPHANKNNKSHKHPQTKPGPKSPDEAQREQQLQRHNQRGQLEHQNAQNFGDRNLGPQPEW